MVLWDVPVGGKNSENSELLIWRDGGSGIFPNLPHARKECLKTAQHFPWTGDIGPGLGQAFCTRRREEWQLCAGPFCTAFAQAGACASVTPCL